MVVVLCVSYFIVGADIISEQERIVVHIPRAHFEFNSNVLLVWKSFIKHRSKKGVKKNNSVEPVLVLLLVPTLKGDHWQL